MLPQASKRNNFHYNKKLKQFAKQNKKQMPKSAVYMWKFILSSGQMLGYKFRRERPILNYIVDFVCLELMLVIEVDGISHETEEAFRKDRKRDQNLKEIGFSVLRFSSLIVIKDRPSVNEIIAGWIEENTDGPSIERGGKQKKKVVSKIDSGLPPPLPPPKGD